MSMPEQVVVAGAFDDIRTLDLRFLQEAARLGPLTVLLASDKAIRDATGHDPRFPFAERQYLLAGVRFVSQIVESPSATQFFVEGLEGAVWMDRERNADKARQRYCQQHGMSYRIISDAALTGFPEQHGTPKAHKKVVVTGCYDWLHSGHVRFFEEASSYGDLYVVVGHDANIRLLKGEGHPLLSEQERRYIVGTIRHVTQTFISSGGGWLDAEPEIRELKPDYYVVNEDGDKDSKRAFCRANYINYIVLQRTPAPGLPPRSSTDLRGF